MSEKNSRRTFIKNTSLGVAFSTIQASFGFSPLQQNNDQIGHGDFRFSLDKKLGCSKPKFIPC